MEDLSEKLAIALQLEDIEEALRNRKGKGKQGDLTTADDEVAFITYRRYLEALECSIQDRRLAKSVDEAVRADGHVLEVVVREERIAENDRNLALRLGGHFAEKCGSDRGSRQMALGSELTDGITEIALNEWQAKLMLEDQTDAVAGPSNTCTKIKATNKCQICFDTFPASSTVSAPCGHIYCHPCMKEVFLGACIDETLFPPRCCRDEIPLHTAEKILSTEELSRFRSKSSEYSSKNRTYCSRPTCSEFIPSGRIQGDVGRCSKCFTETCVMCKKERHPGDCPEDKSLDLTLGLAAQSGWQRCKNCHALVELSSGCHHMTCRCKAEWCYNCGATWKQCGCSDWEEGRLTRRAEELAMRRAPQNLNPAAFARIAQELRRNLQVNHECRHVSGWRFQNGPAQCEMCDFDLPQYIFVCRRCELLACNRCRKNRI